MRASALELDSLNLRSERAAAVGRLCSIRVHFPLAVGYLNTTHWIDRSIRLKSASSIAARKSDTIQTQTNTHKKTDWSPPPPPPCKALGKWHWTVIHHTQSFLPILVNEIDVRHWPGPFSPRALEREWNCLVLLPPPPFRWWLHFAHKWKSYSATAFNRIFFYSIEKFVYLRFHLITAAKKTRHMFITRLTPFQRTFSIYKSEENARREGYLRSVLQQRKKRHKKNKMRQGSHGTKKRTLHHSDFLLPLFECIWSETNDGQRFQSGVDVATRTRCEGKKG